MVQGRGNQAERAFENALILAEKTGDEDNLAWSSNNLAILRSWSGEFSAAAELYGAARRIHTASAFRLGVVMVDNNHSELLLWQGRLDEAGETARTVVEGARRLSNGTLQVSGLETLARVSLERGDLEGAERALDEALSTGRDDDVLALVYACSARVAMARGDLPRAQAWAQRALAATEGGGMPNERLTAVAMLGQTLGRAGRTLEARRFLQQALAIARDGDMRLHAATIVRHLGRLERRQGNVEAAERLLLAALAEHRRYGAELEAAHDLLELAELQLATGAGVAGEECARQALATYERLGAWAGAAAATDLLARGPSATGVAAGATLADAAPTGRPLW
jgi:tetratricopeptide (TPR) repeat protein